MRRKRFDYACGFAAEEIKAAFLTNQKVCLREAPFTE